MKASPSAVVIWYRNDVRIRLSRRIQAISDKDGIIHFIILNVIAADAGTYKCIASNAAGYAHCEFQLSVQNDLAGIIPSIGWESDLPYSKEPLFVNKPTSFEAFEGDTVLIDLVVVGDPKPSVIWLQELFKVRKKQILKT